MYFQFLFLQIYVITSRQRYQFSYNKEVKYQWNTISCEYYDS